MCLDPEVVKHALCGCSLVSLAAFTVYSVCSPLIRFNVTPNSPILGILLCVQTQYDRCDRMLKDPYSTFLFYFVPTYDAQVMLCTNQTVIHFYMTILFRIKQVLCL